jgi:hypothetical protein
LVHCSFSNAKPHFQTPFLQDLVYQRSDLEAVVAYAADRAIRVIPGAKNASLWSEFFWCLKLNVCQDKLGMNAGRVEKAV